LTNTFLLSLLYDTIGLAVARPGADLALPALRVPLTVCIAETGKIDINKRKEKGGIAGKIRRLPFKTG
jgi:hypothetical protein